MVSRYRRGYAFTSTREGQEFHLHEEEVIEDRATFAPYPPLSLKAMVSGKRIAPAG